MDRKSDLSALELLTSDTQALLWILEWDEILEENRKELFGVNHANWKNPRRGFYFDGFNYHIDADNKLLLKEKVGSNIYFVREFDKIMFSRRYVMDETPEEVLNSFLDNGYKIKE